MNPFSIITGTCRVVVGLVRGLYVLGLVLVGAVFLMFGGSVILADIRTPEPYTLLSVGDMMAAQGFGATSSALFYFMPVLLGFGILAFAMNRAQEYLDPGGEGLAVARRALREDRIRQLSER
jgi:hypothetical protein